MLKSKDAIWSNWQRQQTRPLSSAGSSPAIAVRGIFSIIYDLLIKPIFKETRGLFLILMDTYCILSRKSVLFNEY